jgi:hypothetical protein
MPKPSQHAGLERRIQPPANSTWNVEEPKNTQGRHYTPKSAHRAA